MTKTTLSRLHVSTGRFAVNETLEKALIQTALYCIEKSNPEYYYVCGHSIELLGGYLVKRIDEITSEISSMFNVFLEPKYIHKLISEKIVKPIVYEKGPGGIDPGSKYLNYLN